MSAQGITVGVQLTSTVVLARLLSPEDYGTLAMVTAVTSFAALFRDLGLSSAAIQKQGLSNAQQSNLFWLNVLMGFALTAIVAGASPLVARFYNKPDLVGVTLLLSLNFIFISMSTQHAAMLIKRMQFVRHSSATIIGALASLAVSVSLAFNGFGYWALAWGMLTGSLVRSILMFIFSPFMPRLPSRGSGIRELVGFGVNVTAFNFVNYFSRNLDNILIGKFIGAEALGLYNRAYQLMMFPITNLKGPIHSVGFPALSQLQARPDEFRLYARKIIGIIAALSMPLVVFLAVCSEWIIPLALGPGWDKSVAIFVILSFTAFFQPVGSIRGQVMLSMGNSNRYFRWGVANSLFVSVSFFLGLRWGVQGIAIAYGVCNTVILYPSLRYAFKDSPVCVRDFFESIARPALTSIASGCFVLFKNVMWTMEPERALGRVFGDSLVFGLVYLGLNSLSREGRQELYYIPTLIIHRIKIIKNRRSSSHV